MDTKGIINFLTIFACRNAEHITRSYYPSHENLGHNAGLKKRSTFFMGK
jgi:hypothetical protein